MSSNKDKVPFFNVPDVCFCTGLILVVLQLFTYEVLNYALGFQIIVLAFIKHYSDTQRRTPERQQLTPQNFVGGYSPTDTQPPERDTRQDGAKGNWVRWVSYAIVMLLILWWALSMLTQFLATL